MQNEKLIVNTSDLDVSGSDTLYTEAQIRIILMAKRVHFYKKRIWVYLTSLYANQIGLQNSKVLCRVCSLDQKSDMYQGFLVLWV